jgi:hypothetical protein
MDGERCFRAYRTTFFLALLVTTGVRVYFVLGFPPELADRGRAVLGQFDFNLWVARLGSVGWVLTLAAGAALVASLATRTYRKLVEGHALPPIDG